MPCTESNLFDQFRKCSFSGKNEYKLCDNSKDSSLSALVQSFQYKNVRHRNLTDKFINKNLKIKLKTKLK